MDEVELASRSSNGSLLCKLAAGSRLRYFHVVLPRAEVAILLALFYENSLRSQGSC
jgi:hypothetical protein